MAFFRRSSSVLRSALTRLQGHEQNGFLRSQQLSAQRNDLGLQFSSIFGARFLCSMPSTKLFVGGLAWGMDENALKEAFIEFGEVVEAKVVLDRESGRSKGFGFVSFTCTDHADAAKNALDGKVLSGRQLRVNFAIEKQRGFGSFGSSYGGGSFGGTDSGSSSYGNASFNSGSSSFNNNDSFSPSGSSSTNGSMDQGNDGFISNNTFNPDTLNNASNGSAADEDNSNENFFGDDVFDDQEDKDENMAQGFK